MYACMWLFYVAELTLLIYIHGPAIVPQSTRPTSQKANRKRLNMRELYQCKGLLLKDWMKKGLARKSR